MMTMTTNMDGSFELLIAENQTAVANLYTSMFTKLKNSGYASAIMKPIKIHPLSPHMFLIITRGLRYKMDKTELMRIAKAVYLVRRVEHDPVSPFRICVTIAHFLPPS